MRKPKFTFRVWDRDNPQDGRSYFDVWTFEGEPVSQTLIPKGLEDAYFELVAAHVEVYGATYAEEIGEGG